MSKRTGFVVISAILAMLGGCATQPNVRVDQDTHIRLSDYRSFAWQAPKAVAATQNPTPIADNNAAASEMVPSPAATSLADDRAHTAIANALQAKGYKLSSDAADFRVNVILNVAERPKESGLRLGVGGGGGSGNVSGGVGFSIPIGKRNEAVAVMTIDMIDSARNAQVWTGRYQLVVKKVDVDAAEMTAMVNALLAKFPAKQ